MFFVDFRTFQKALLIALVRDRQHKMQLQQINWEITTNQGTILQVITDVIEKTASIPWYETR